MGDRLGDGETDVSGLIVPLVFILYCNAKAIAGLLATRKLLFIVTLLKNLRLSNIKTWFYQPHRALPGFLTDNYPKQPQINTVLVQQ